MATNLEIEFKNMLTETEYDRLIQTFNIQEEQIWLQKNVYFDTKSHDLKQKGAALRIRVKNNTYELTLIDGSKLPVSRSYVNTTKKALGL